MEGFRVVPYFRGQDGYLDMSETGMGADWDFGILNRSSYATLTKFQAVGYWRMAGLGKVATPVATEVCGNIILRRPSNCSRCMVGIAQVGSIRNIQTGWHGSNVHRSELRN
ncbi:hypothetical protein D3C77_609840 [compost metagenome]